MSDNDLLTFEQLRKIQSQENQQDTLQELDDSFFGKVRDYLDRKKRMGSYQHDREYVNARHIVEDIIDSRQKKILRLAFLASTSPLRVDNLLHEEEPFFDKVRESVTEHRKQLEDKVFEDDESGPADSSMEDEGADEKTMEEESAPEAEPAEDADETGGEREDSEEDDDGGGTGAESGEETKEDIRGKTTDDAEPGDAGQDREDDADEELLFGGGDEEDPGSAGVTVEITAEVPEFMGVDMEAYGPFENGDVVELPEDNANVLVDRGSAEIRE